MTWQTIDLEAHYHGNEMDGHRGYLQGEAVWEGLSSAFDQRAANSANVCANGALNPPPPPSGGLGLLEVSPS